MEYVDGITLRRPLRACSDSASLPTPGVACHIAAEVAGALSYVHTLVDDNRTPLEIVHRDITPANIMISTAGDVKLFDFGLARAARHVRRDRTAKGVLKGTLRFMSPEQASGGSIDARSDIFSLGVVLYECLTGRPLFTGNELQVIYQICERDSPPVTEARPELGAEIAEVVARMLARDREKRFASGAAVVAALAPVIDKYSGREAAVRELRSAAPLQRRQPEASPDRHVSGSGSWPARPALLGAALLAIVLALLATFAWVRLR